MPERVDKNGPPELAVQIKCQHADCGHIQVVTGANADRLGGKLWAYNRVEGKRHIRELIAEQHCEKCQRRFVSLHFKLHYRGYTAQPRQQHDLAQFIPNPM